MDEKELRKLAEWAAEFVGWQRDNDGAWVDTDGAAHVSAICFLTSLDFAYKVIDKCCELFGAMVVETQCLTGRHMVSVRRINGWWYTGLSLVERGAALCSAVKSFVEED